MVLCSEVGRLAPNLVQCCVRLSRHLLHKKTIYSEGTEKNNLRQGNAVKGSAIIMNTNIQKTRKRQQPEPGTQEVPPDMGKSFFTAKMAEHWSRVPRETVGIVSFCGDTQKLFRCKHEKRALGDLASAGMLEQMTSSGPFQPGPFRDSV